MNRLLLVFLFLGFAAPLAGAADPATSPMQDDALPRLSINDVTVTEGDTGTTAATFAVSLDVPGVLPVSVQYATADGTARAPGDYQQTSGTVTIPAGETSRPVTVQVNGDTLDEVNETFKVNLTDPVNATIEDGQGVATITDDDPQSALSIDDVSVTEGNSGDRDAVFTVSLDRASGITITVQYATADGTAVQPADYHERDGMLNFPAGQTTRTVTVKVHGDTLDEDDEFYFVNLSDPTNATIADGQGIGTIIDDDGAPPPPPPPPAPPPPPPPPPAPPPPPPPVPPPPPPPPPPPAPRSGRAALYAPPNGARVSAPPLLAWRAVPRARFYNVQLYRKGRKVLSAWPRRPRLQLHRRWRYGGRAKRLRVGPYTWVVWPAFGTSITPRYGRALGVSTFRYVSR